MEKDKKEKPGTRLSELVHTPEPPQVMDPSKVPQNKKKNDVKKKSVKRKR